MLQTNIQWNQPKANIAVAEQLMAQGKASDLYVLPEMWSTGFVTEPEGIASAEADSVALRWMQQMARELHCALCGSLAVRLADGTFRNRHYFVDGRSGRTFSYDKHHLFTYGDEHRFYTPGSQRTVVNYGGWRWLLLTCYDLRFPLWSRYAEAYAYDAIIVVANWPASRQSAWQLLTRARAVENQCYLLGVNRVGDDPCSHYVGASCAIDPIGRTLGQCRREAEQALTVELSMADLQRRRERFRVLDDRDIR